MEWFVTASFVIMVVLLLVGVPVPLVFFGTMLFLVIAGGYRPSFLFPFAYATIASMTIITLPLFIIAGGIVEKGGLGEHLINFVNLFFGRFKAGLGIVAVVATAVFSSVSGSAYACLIVIGSIMMPRMRKAGYDDAVSGALIANASMLGAYIPPSGMMLIFAWITNQSVLACFLATIIPGIIFMFFLSIWIHFQCRNNPNIKMPEIEPLPQKMRTIRNTTWQALPALFFPVIVLGGIYGGIMTVTEAAAVSVLYAIPVALFIYRRMNLKDLVQTLIETGTSAGVVVVMIFTVSLITRIYLIENLPQVILAGIYQVTENRYMILLIINLVLILVGLLMDSVSAMLLSVPILLPIVVQVDVHPVHFAAIVAVNLGLGGVTPPCSPLLFVAARVGQTSLTRMMRPNFSIIFTIWLPMIVLVTIFPSLSLWLPRFMGLIR